MPFLSSCSFEEIGEQLGITARTVKYHTDNMRHKFGVKNKRELIRLLKAEGLIE